VALTRIGDYADATRRFEAVLKRRPKNARIWLSYGHSLKTIGRGAESVAAYRRAIELKPTLGEAWWSLANLKSIRFDAADAGAMERALQAGSALTDDDRLHLHFALGRAHEDAAAPEPPTGTTRQATPSAHSSSTMTQDRLRRWSRRPSNDWIPGSSLRDRGRATLPRIRSSSLACRAPARH